MKILLKVNFSKYNLTKAQYIPQYLLKLLGGNSDFCAFL